MLENAKDTLKYVTGQGKCSYQKLENTLNREIMEILHIKTNRKNDALQLKWYLEIYALKPCIIKEIRLEK